MRNKIIELTKKLISMNSVSSNSNKEIIYFIDEMLIKAGFTSEILKYKDPNGIQKYNLVSRRGIGSGGLAFLMHSDTVPLASEDQLITIIKDNKLYGRGSCDMKGPIAAALLAIISSKETVKPLTIIITSDEEIGCEGAGFLVKNSKTLKQYPPEWGVATEPTELKPVYAHKGLAQIIITAHGKAAHSSTSVGVSANFKMAPFLYFISKLKEKYNVDSSYQNSEFDPPTNTLNMTLTDFDCALNVTAAKSRCKLCLRAMPNARTEEIIKEIITEAERLGLDSQWVLLDSLHTDPGSKFVKDAEIVTNRKAETVAYLTDASMFTPMIKSIILGPGSIKQAHTEDEFIDIDELVEGYEIYCKLIK